MQSMIKSYYGFTVSIVSKNQNTYKSDTVVLK